MAQNSENHVCDRVLAELASIRLKYNQAIFDLQIAKERISVLESENKQLSKQVEQNKSLKQSTDGEIISLSSRLDKVLNDPPIIREKKTPEAEKNLIAILKKENNVLQARLKQFHSNSHCKCQTEFDDSCIKLVDSQSDLNESGDNDKNEEFEVERILNHKFTRTRRTFLIRWKGYDSKEDEWIEESCLSNCSDMLNEYMEKIKL